MVGEMKTKARTEISRSKIQTSKSNCRFKVEQSREQFSTRIASNSAINSDQKIESKYISILPEQVSSSMFVSKL